MNTQEFSQTLYGGATSGWLSVWTLPDKKTAFFPIANIPAAVSYAESLFDTHDVYYGVGLRGEKLGERQRGGNDDVTVVPALWSDIDIQSPAHKETALPQSAKEALAFLDSLPLKPSIVVNSGNGLHVYWLLDKPLGIATKAHRDNIAHALKGWQQYINAAAKEKGWKLDNTSDLSRVLRLPGGINHKLDNNARAEVISVNDNRYTPSDFTPYIQSEADTASDGSPMANRSADGTEKFTGTTGAASRIFEKCAFMRHCRDNAATLPEPQWYAMVSNLSLCADGKEQCHACSKAYPGYNAAETEGKIAHAITAAKPHTCAYIQQSLGFDCGECSAGCKAPVALAVVTKAELVKNLLEADLEDWNEVYTDKGYLDALCYAKAVLPGDYAKFKVHVKGKVNIPDLERCLKAHAKESRPADEDEESLELDGIDLGGAKVPRRWQVSNKHGVRRAFAAKDSDTEVVACPDPVVITRRLVNLDDGKEKLELSFRRDGHWKTTVGNRTQVYNKASILGFGDEGLHVTSGTAAELVSYLSDYEMCNKKIIPRVSSIARLGWIEGTTQFFPYAVNEPVMFEEDKGTAALYRNLAEQGDYTAWKAMMARLRKNPLARFITSAAFASPLLCKIGVRTFVIHHWANSGAGKSAVLKAAISVFGNPLRIMGNGFTTIVGTEQLAGTLRHLPFGIDEKQSADEKRMSLEHLIYVLGQGSGKIRGARGGGNAEVATWHNIVMLTGEEPVTRTSSLDGVQTRTFEIYGSPIENPDFAKEVHIVSEQNYGFAGAAFMRAVCAKLKENPDSLRQEYLSILEELKRRGLKNIHADYVAAVCLGDILAETVVFGTDAETARREALSCGEAVYAVNEAQMSTNVVDRAWDFIKGWLVSNEFRFSPDAAPFYGKSEAQGQDSEYSVIPAYLDSALEDAGFNVKKTLQGLREQGYIATQKDSEGKERTKKLVWIYGKPVRCYVFKLATDNVPPLRGENE